MDIDILYIQHLYVAPLFVNVMQRTKRYNALWTRTFNLFERFIWTLIVITSRYTIIIETGQVFIVWKKTFFLIFHWKLEKEEDKSSLLHVFNGLAIVRLPV